MLSTALNSLIDAQSLLLRNQLEKRGVLENLDVVLLCLDETVDDGCVAVSVLILTNLLPESSSTPMPLLSLPALAGHVPTQPISPLMSRPL